MTPAQPPLPTDWSLPFHPDAGSHTSILTSESLEGVKVAVTRQNAGRWPNSSAESCPPASAPAGAGGAKVPAATLVADTIFVSGSERLATLSHDAAAAVEALNVTVASRAKKRGRTIGRYAALLANTATSSRQFYAIRHKRESATRGNSSGISDFDLWLVDHTILLPSTQRICHQSRPQRDQVARNTPAPKNG